MKVALIVGHSKTSQGAKNASDDASEFEFNDSLAKDIKEDLRGRDEIEVVIVYRENGYAQLPYEVNALKPDLVVSLHCNAYNTEVNGCEMLYYHKSTKGEEIAKIFQNKIVNALDNDNRGLKPCDSEDRGGHLLKATDAPCIICEPFFIDNDDDYQNALTYYADLVDAYDVAIRESIEYLKGI